MAFRNVVLFILLLEGMLEYQMQAELSSWQSSRSVSLCFTQHPLAPYEIHPFLAF